MTLDGLDINDQATGSSFQARLIPVSIDALQEVRTGTAGETADYGAAAAVAASNIVTKSGTKTIGTGPARYNAIPFCRQRLVNLAVACSVRR